MREVKEGGKREEREVRGGAKRDRNVCGGKQGWRGVKRAENR